MGIAELDSFIARVRGLKLLPTEVAKAAAPRVEGELKRSASAGTTPYGEKWPQKKDGGKPLVNAAAAVSCKAIGSVVEMSIDDYVHRIHNSGAEGGVPSRQMLPDGTRSLPQPIVVALEASAAEVFERRMGGT